MKEIPKIVLTGGPCSGKTTALRFIQEKLSDWGWRVFLVPEVATMVIGGGIEDLNKIAKEDHEKYFRIEEQMLILQRSLELGYTQMANLFLPEQKIVMIHDRGAMDVQAYLPSKEHFGAILGDNKLTLADVRDKYTSVIHMRTAAIGAEQFYTTENNKARRENLEEARKADEKALNAWVGHPHLIIIDNSTNFECKLGRVLKAIARVLGIPIPLEIENKYLLKKIPDLGSEFFHDAQEILIEQMYLCCPNENEEIRIRKRSQGDSHMYYRTHKIKVRSGVRQETEEAISAKEYVDLQALKDPSTRIIRKSRICLIYKNQYFELDIFRDPPNLCLLEIELTEENDKVEIPPFLEIEKDVTDDKKYSNKMLATLPAS